VLSRSRMIDSLCRKVGLWRTGSNTRWQPRGFNWPTAPVFSFSCLRSCRPCPKRDENRIVYLACKSMVGIGFAHLSGLMDGTNLQIKMWNCVEIDKTKSRKRRRFLKRMKKRRIKKKCFGENLICCRKEPAEAKLLDAKKLVWSQVNPKLHRAELLLRESQTSGVEVRTFGLLGF
jgi:hypothetical protein